MKEKIESWEQELINQGDAINKMKRMGVNPKRNSPKRPQRTFLATVGSKDKVGNWK